MPWAACQPCYGVGEVKVDGEWVTCKACQGNGQVQEWAGAGMKERIWKWLSEEHDIARYPENRCRHKSRLGLPCWRYWVYDYWCRRHNKQCWYHAMDVNRHPWPGYRPEGR